MMGSQRSPAPDTEPALPGWLPEPVRVYLAHVEGGQSIRALARAEGRHASTVLRQVRRTEALRDAPLADAALTRIGALWRRRAGARPTSPEPQEKLPMTAPVFDETLLKAETLRVLKTLSAPETELVVAEKLTDAVLVLNPKGGRPTNLGSVRREVAETLTLRGLIAGSQGQALARYRITAAGRAEAMRLIAEGESRRASATGKAEDADSPETEEALFGRPPGARRAAGSGASADHRSAAARGRSAGAESPLLVLARRKAPDGGPFLTSQDVAAGLRFRTTFEIARMDQSLTRDWERLVCGRITGTGPAAVDGTPTRRLEATRDLETAIRRLGPELAEVAILAVCNELGMESIEEKLGFSARAGKNILKIALQMLARHYDGAGSQSYDLIG